MNGDPLQHIDEVSVGIDAMQPAGDDEGLHDADMLLLGLDSKRFRYPRQWGVEPTLKEPMFFNSRVVRDLAQFKIEANVIFTNRMTDDIREVTNKIYSLDLFGQG